MSWLLIDLFVNYDCYLYTDDLYSKIIEFLSRMCQFGGRDSDPFAVKRGLTFQAPNSATTSTTTTTTTTTATTTTASTVTNTTDSGQVGSVSSAPSTSSSASSSAASTSVLSYGISNTATASATLSLLNSPSLYLSLGLNAVSFGTSGFFGGGSTTISPEGVHEEAQLKTLCLVSLVSIYKSLEGLLNSVLVERKKSPHPTNGAQNSTLSIKANTSTTTTPALITNASIGLRRQREVKSLLERAKESFAFKPKLGLSLLFSEGLLKDTPSAIASFLKNTPGLDKEKIGEYLGDHRNVPVLHAYIDSFSFQNLEIDIALRHLLLAFKLPGEAAQIERIMEKFASNYYADNKDTTSFKSSDGAFLLAFATIMLATDRHNPAIVEKITLEAWKRNLMLADKEGNYGFSTTQIDEVFQRICAEPLKLGNVSNIAKSTGVGPKQRQEAFYAELNQLSKKTLKSLESIQSTYLQKQLPNQQDKSSNTSDTHDHQKEIEGNNYTPVNPSFIKEHPDELCVSVKSMFEASWGSVLAALSVTLEHSSDIKVIEVCLEGFKASTELCCHLSQYHQLQQLQKEEQTKMTVGNEELERDTVVGTLSKFTSLDSTMIMGKLIDEKQIKAINLLIKVTTEQGDYLETSWKMVLRALSQLSDLFTLGSGKEPETVSGLTSSLTNNISTKSTNNVDGSTTTAATDTTTSETTEDKQPKSTDSNEQDHQPDDEEPERGEEDQSQNQKPLEQDKIQPPLNQQQLLQQQQQQQLKQANAVILGKSFDPEIITNIFAGSTRLSDIGLFYLLSALCDVSREELLGTTGSTPSNSNSNPTSTTTPTPTPTPTSTSTSTSNSSSSSGSTSTSSNTVPTINTGAVSSTTTTTATTTNTTTTISTTATTTPINININTTNAKPRVFCLDKLMQVIMVNLVSQSRSNSFWVDAWNKILVPFFIRTGTSSNTQVALCTLEFLRTMSTKFVGLLSFTQDDTFQVLVFKPFLEIVENRLLQLNIKNAEEAPFRNNSNITTVTDYAVDCVHKILSTCANSLNTGGWAVLLRVLETQAFILHAATKFRNIHKREKSVVDKTIFIFKQIWREKFYLLHFENYLKALTAFAIGRTQNSSQPNPYSQSRPLTPRSQSPQHKYIVETSPAAEYLTTVGKIVINFLGDISSGITSENTTNGAGKDDKRRQTNWTLLIRSLVSIVNDSSLLILRGISRKLIVQILIANGAQFDNELWLILFGDSCLWRLFDNICPVYDKSGWPLLAPNTKVRPNGESSGNTNELTPPHSNLQNDAILGTYVMDQEWLMMVCFHVLNDIVTLFGLFYDNMDKSILTKILKIISSCVITEMAELGSFGHTVLSSLLQQNIHRFSKEDWKLITDTFVHILRQTQPSRLFDLTTLLSQHLSKANELPTEPQQDETDEAEEGEKSEKNEPAVGNAQTVISKLLRLESISIRCDLRIHILSILAKCLEPKKPQEQDEKATVEEQEPTIPKFLLDDEVALVIISALKESTKFTQQITKDFVLQKALFTISPSLQDLIAKEEALSSCTLINLVFGSTVGVLNSHFGECLYFVDNYLVSLRKYLQLIDTKNGNKSLEKSSEEIWLSKLLVWKIPSVLCTLHNMNNILKTKRFCVVSANSERVFLMASNLLASTSKSIRVAATNVVLTLKETNTTNSL